MEALLFTLKGKKAQVRQVQELREIGPWIYQLYKYADRRA